MLPQLYVIHDGRALTQPPEDCCIYSTAGTFDEAMRDMGSFPDGVLFVYDVDLDGRTLLNGRAVP